MLWNFPSACCFPSYARLREMDYRRYRTLVFVRNFDLEGYKSEVGELYALDLHFGNDPFYKVLLDRHEPDEESTKSLNLTNSSSGVQSDSEPATTISEDTSDVNQPDVSEDLVA